MRKSKELTTSADPLWYKDAIIYQLHVKSFFDANDDGIGDFRGLTAKLDYVVELGVNTLWLLPFYPSPRRDDGYDISDFRAVHTDYGSLADVKALIKAAHQRNLKVVTELVINHTSDQHAWFQRARKARKGSAYRNFYVWSDKDDLYSETRIIFIDTEKSNWTWDHDANAYFWHRFYSHQPDLNFDNPRVLKEVLRVMRFWLDLGVDGLRLDAIPYLVEREGTNNENLPETHAVLKEIRKELDLHYHDKMLLGEANQWPEDARQYFGDGDECHMAFHFPLMPRMYMAIAQEDRFPISDIMRQTPQLPETCQWAVFLRNHDELTLEMVTDRERDYLWETYATNRRARLNLGIRRRLGPLMEHDRRRIELMNGLLLSMPGTPVIYYGDEIGMGDNIHLGDRDGVRTPMQWTPDRNGGFSRADPARLTLPAIMDPLYGFQAVNVEAQKGDPHSLLNWMRRMLAVRRGEAAFGRGDFKLLAPGNRKILAFLRSYEGALILCVSNLSRTVQAVELDLSAMAGHVPVDMVGGTSFPPVGQLPYLLTLPPYGFYWFRLATVADLPKWHKPAPEPLPDLYTFVLHREIGELLRDPSISVLETEILPSYLAKRRWFAGKNAADIKVKIAYAERLADGKDPLLLSEIDVTLGDVVERYQIPLGVIWEEEIKTALPQQLALSRLRIGRRVGILTDALSVERYALTLLNNLARRAKIMSQDGEISFFPAEGKELDIDLREGEVRHLAAEQSNSTVIVNDEILLKLFRRVQSGIHPEAEMGHHLVKVGFKNIPELRGEVRRVDAEGVQHTLALAFSFLRNQGDGWSWTLNFLERWLEDGAAADASVDARNAAQLLAPYDAFVTALGRCLGQFHLAMVMPTDDDAFAAEPVTARDLKVWAAQMKRTVSQALSQLKDLKHPDTATAAEIEKLLSNRHILDDAVNRLPELKISSKKIRIHGDFHLGQTLTVQNDVYMIDFEGEPLKPLAERRSKQTPLRDVAGILRSFDYAAAAATQNLTISSIQDDDENAHMLPMFRTRAVATFLRAYKESQQESPDKWLDSAEDKQLLRICLMEKAAYEISYELGNRPNWLIYPLRGLNALLEGFSAEEEA
jgi:maltose alpha-D-glucosyltransferase/alpha-amylase